MFAHVFKDNPYHDAEGKLTTRDNAVSVSASSGPLGELFASMPVGKATSPEAKKWRKAMQKEYNENADFRAAMDAATLFTQGDYSVIRNFTHHAVTGKHQDRYVDSAVPKWENERMFGNPMSGYKDYFDGQNFSKEFEEKNPNGKKSIATFSDGGRAINKAIREAVPQTESIYRGLKGRDAVQSMASLKEGDTFELLGVSSFTKSKSLAEEFSQGTAKGQGTQRDYSDLQAIVEIMPGAKALNVSAVSPYDQQELITSGRFKVRSVEVLEKSQYGDRPKKVKVTLEQIAVWGVSEVQKLELVTPSVKNEVEWVRLMFGSDWIPRMVQQYAKIMKANPYHDSTGAFTSRDKANVVSIGPTFRASNSRDAERATRLKTKIIPTPQNAKQRAKITEYMNGFSKNLKNPQEKAYAEARIRQMVGGESRPSGMSGQHGITKQRAAQYEALIYKIFTAGRRKIDV